ncbi:MAG: HAMP domain-containing sensor histidine kinase [Chloroflexota bacterium]
MRTLALRYWLIVALATYFVGSVMPFAILGIWVCTSETLSQQAASMSDLLSANVAHWAEPTWQQALSEKLSPDLGLVLLDNANHELFRSGKYPLNRTDAGRVQIVVMEGTRELGVANLYDVSPCGGLIYGTIGIPASLLLQITVGICIALILNRYLLRPLSAMSKAARQIADGDLDFQIPRSRVREVAQVASAFSTMGTALRGSLTQQAELEQDRRFFISAIAHDLRTPLFALRGYLAGIERGLANTPEKMNHYIAVCQEKADALERLIADLFAYSRLEYLEQLPQRDLMDFKKLVENTVEDIRFQAQARGISVTVDHANSSGDVKADWSLLARALGNVLDNALHYTPDKGSIQVSWRKENHLVKFVVADSGPGIAPHDLPHVFNALYRGETSRNRETGGAGLGLTIARRILQAHGGDLVATNLPGGAEFTGSISDI